MNISTIWKDGGKYPSFNLELASKEGAEAFLSIRGCRIVDGPKGQFVAYPSRKTEEGKYWNHVWANERFNEAVLEKALASMPKQNASPKPSKPSDDNDDIPF
jgi:DNA-binding cell septation regulator SpoVG